MNVNFRVALFVTSLIFSLAPNSAVQAADGNVSQQTGIVKGRVFNPASQEYVRNAEVSIEGTNLIVYSGDDGSYVLSGVPAGEVRVTVTYTGYDPAVSNVALQPGQTATRDFELKGSTFR